MPSGKRLTIEDTMPKILVNMGLVFYRFYAVSYIFVFYPCLYVSCNRCILSLQMILSLIGFLLEHTHRISCYELWMDTR